MIKSFENFNSSDSSLENFKVLMFHIFEQVNKKVTAFQNKRIEKDILNFTIFNKDKTSYTLACFFNHSALDFIFDYMYLDNAVITAKIHTMNLESFNKTIKDIIKPLNLKLESIIEDPISDGTDKKHNNFTFLLNIEDLESNEKALNFIESIKGTNKYNL